MEVPIASALKRWLTRYASASCWRASGCTDCHTKIFPMKKQDLKMTKEAHGQDKHCGVCHNGTKAFSQNKDSDCAKCHKKA